MTCGFEIRINVYVRNAEVLKDWQKVERMLYT